MDLLLRIKNCAPPQLMQFTFWHESSVENSQSTLNKTSSLYTSIIFAPVLKVNQSFSFKYALQELPEPLG